MIPGRSENKVSTLILAVGGYTAYTLLVANITNVARYILHLPLTSTTVFAVALALAAGIMLLERRFTRGWPVANYYNSQKKNCHGHGCRDRIGGSRSLRWTEVQRSSQVLLREGYVCRRHE